MITHVLYDIFKSTIDKFKDPEFIISYSNDRNNPNGIYLKTKIGTLYFHYIQKEDAWILTNNLKLKNTIFSK